MISLSRIVAGMWRLADWPYDAQDLLNFIKACTDCGVTSFDHADIYGDYACEDRFIPIVLSPKYRMVFSIHRRLF